MIVYTINPEPWEHIFWTAAVMAGAGIFAGIAVYIFISHYMREMRRHHERVYHRLTSLERRLVVLEKAINLHPHPADQPNQPAAPLADDGIRILR